jgi:CubicO group peptidase (beta-lactamase class C family)
MTDDTWFDLASLTKVIFTTPRILALADAGTDRSRCAADRLLPDFRQYNADCWERKVTFRQCLGHQTPFPAVFPDLHLWPRPGPAARLRAAARMAGGAFGLFRHQLHPPRPGARAAGAQNDPRHGCRFAGFAWSADPAAAAATEDDTWRHRVLVRRGA